MSSACILPLYSRDVRQARSATNLRLPGFLLFRHTPVRVRKTFSLVLFVMFSARPEQKKRMKVQQERYCQSRYFTAQKREIHGSNIKASCFFFLYSTKSLQIYVLAMSISEFTEIIYIKFHASIFQYIK